MRLRPLDRLTGPIRFASIRSWACRHVSDAGLDWAGIDVRRVLPLVAVYLVVSLVGAFLWPALSVLLQLPQRPVRSTATL